MGFIEWFEAGGLVAVGTAIYIGLELAGHITGMVDGPDPDDRASKGLAMIDKLKGLLRAVGLGTYKNEPGTNSLPLVPDSGKRVTE